MGTVRRMESSILACLSPSSFARVWAASPVHGGSRINSVPRAGRLSLFSFVLIPGYAVTFPSISSTENRPLLAPLSLSLTNSFPRTLLARPTSSTPPLALPHRNLASHFAPRLRFSPIPYSYDSLGKCCCPTKSASLSSHSTLSTECEAMFAGPSPLPPHMLSCLHQLSN